MIGHSFNAIDGTPTGIDASTLQKNEKWRILCAWKYKRRGEEKKKKGGGGGFHVHIDLQHLQLIRPCISSAGEAAVDSRVRTVVDVRCAG